MAIRAHEHQSALIELSRIWIVHGFDRQRYSAACRGRLQFGARRGISKS
jgi:hypothetical protein